MAGDIVKSENGFYILSTSSRVDDRTRVLKQGDMFAIFDRFGDIEEYGTGALGIYHDDTRFLSKLVLRLAGERPLMLSSAIKDDNAVLAVDLMNPDIQHAHEVTIPRGTVHVFRTKVLWDSTCHERLHMHNYGLAAVDIALTVEFDCDFRDIFEVRGAHRERRGRFVPPQTTPDSVLLAYEGLDRRMRGMRFTFSPAPDTLSPGEARYMLHLAPGAGTNVHIEMTCSGTDQPAAVISRTKTESAAPSGTRYEEAAKLSADSLAEFRHDAPVILTSSVPFNDWLMRCETDLHMMSTDTSYGRYPYAGVPWFSTVFGRDGLITALEFLCFRPHVARGVLKYLAATQAEGINEEQDAQPGKILHETRSGEMAILGEVPFGRYYGSVDSTPLFVMLAGAYYQRTGDLPLIRELWPHVERALSWIDRYGDADGDGFVEYARRSRHGLVQQGWKDSHDSIFHADGRLAEPPIALSEVQGYTYAAKTAAAMLSRALGMSERGNHLAASAAVLRDRFDEAFWCEHLGCYALALDGRKKRCAVVTSNAGQCLFTGIASDDHARRVAGTLLQQQSFSGWGIRTVATSEARYNPMSYHNGSVWPHDNALIAAGFARYGLRSGAVRVLTSLFDASRSFDLHRPPELFCGFHRRAGESPTLYPVSCSPQTWASGAVFLMLTACLGLEIDAPQRTVTFASPTLPDMIHEMQISGLRVLDASVDLAFIRHGDDVAVNVLRREGECAVRVLK